MCPPSRRFAMRPSADRSLIGSRLRTSKPPVSLAGRLPTQKFRDSNVRITYCLSSFASLVVLLPLLVFGVVGRRFTQPGGTNCDLRPSDEN
jgi:hypothetical protein